jgi:hypothetical protein
MPTTYAVTQEIARLLSDERRRLKRSQASAARAIGMSQTTLQKIENCVMKESSFLRELWLWLGLPAERFDELQHKATGVEPAVHHPAIAVPPNGNKPFAEPIIGAEGGAVAMEWIDAQLIRRVVWNDFTRVIGSRVLTLEHPKLIQPTQVAVALMRRDQQEARLVMTRDVAEQLAYAILFALGEEPGS